MPKCAFLSIANTEGWFIDDDLVHEPLTKLGWEVDNIPWNQPTDWNAYHVVVIRSPWDYQDHLEQFLDVLEQIEKSSALLLNDISIVRWNINKNYLFELEQKGIQLVPSIRKTGPNHSDIEKAYKTFKTSELIIKPIIGANADDTFRIPKQNTEVSHKVIQLFQDRECILQPFMKYIVEEGEFSLMYFNGELSHVILKTVGNGDFRVQEEHGGDVIPIIHPEPRLLEAAGKAMKALPAVPMYARVDLVRTARNDFALMELELIEPCLYFRFDPKSATRFAACIDDQLKRVQA
ncbi:ATP-grasp domain-containing protein [Fulvivirga sedimenti]|uniref:Prokaryotic glutathione synthetase ATP-binding domain-containing protein n=1 Tax=Fulvivirga sedimenti TaxID=2879465 RepID=A0A9X1HSQ2_9BACT|nr:hypothetical protein [Fulvivirga sedimenti]MCA6075061.1 hypothetical protein [Fulvivirga sedimenti]MCA6076238.1 hypothetical protein [Fulvivirga sedimenti]MCA6077366.1 hypothetical protein [Fulvivirga sedimenti]